GAAQRVQPAFREGWRGPGAGLGHRLPEPGVILMGPEFLARQGVVADNRLLLAPLFLGEQPAADDDDARPRRADLLPPQEARRILVPVRGDRPPADHTFTLRAAKLGPVARTDRRRPLRGRG